MKNYQLAELTDLSGPRAKIYSVYENEDDDLTLFEQFLQKYEDEFASEINSLLVRLDLMATKYGVDSRFIKPAEGTKPTDKVVALFDEEKTLRVYGIWHNSLFIILGGGGPKPDGVIKWQDDPELKKAAERMIAIDRHLQKQIDEGTIEIDGSDIIDMND